MCLGSTLTVGTERLYKLEAEEFLNEPTYVHRCQLIDDTVQRDILQKYIDLIKNIATKNDSDEIDDEFDKDDSLNSSLISLENIEIDVHCSRKELTKINPKFEQTNYQYTVSVVDFKRIKGGVSTKRSIAESFQCDQSNSQQRTNEAMTSFYADKSIQLLLNKNKPCADDTAENTCTAPNSQPQNMSNLLNNTTGSTSIVSCHVSSSLKLQTIESNLKDKQNSLNDNELNQNETLYAISESTRIHNVDDKNCTLLDDIGDTTQTNGFTSEINKDRDATLNAESHASAIVSGEHFKNGGGDFLHVLEPNKMKKSNG